MEVVGAPTVRAMNPFFNMSLHLYEKFQMQGWIDTSLPLTALSLRVCKGDYITLPSEQAHLNDFQEAVLELNCEAAMIINSSLVRGFISKLGQGTVEVPFSSSERVQVVETISDLKTARRAQLAALVRKDQVLVVWADQVSQLQEIASHLSRTILQFVIDNMNDKPSHRQDRTTRLWSQEQIKAQMSATRPPFASKATSGSNSVSDATSEPQEAIDEKFSLNSSASSSTDIDQDQESLKAKPRTITLQAPLIHGLGLALNIFSICKLAGILVERSIIDKTYSRMAGLALAPIFFCLSAFLFDKLLCLLFLTVGPIKQMNCHNMIILLQCTLVSETP